MAYDPNLGYDPNNIAKSINEAAARGDDAEVERLAVARYQKIQQDPALMQKYGTDAYSQVAQRALRNTGAVSAPPDTSVAGAVTQQPEQKQQTFPEMMQWIDTLYGQQRASALAGLDQSRQAALSSLGAERTALTPQYAAQRQQIAATGDVEAQRLNEFLAAQGLARSGAAGALQGRVGAQTTGQLAQARQSEAQALADILRRQTDVEAQYQMGVQGATSAAEAARLQALIEQARSDRQYGLQEAAYTGMLPGGVQTIQGQQAAREAEEYAQGKIDTARQRELDTIGQYSGDYMKEIQRRQSTADTSDDWMIPYLTAARNQKIAAQAASQSEAAGAQYKQAFEMFEALGVANGWIAQTLGLPEGATTQEYLKTLYDVSKPYFAPRTGTTTKDTGLSSMGTEQQLNEYYTWLNSFVTGGVGSRSPEAAYSAALGEYRSLVNVMGEKLANRLLADLKSRASTVGEPKPESPADESDIVGMTDDFNSAPDKQQWYFSNYGMMTEKERKIADRLYSAWVSSPK